MSAFGSDLFRFGLDPASPPDQAQWENLCRLLRAIVKNPYLQIGTENSQIVFPPTPAAGARAATEASPDLPFCYKFMDGSTKKLRGGIVIGGETNQVIGDITLANTATDNTFLWIRVNFKANMADHVLLPGVEKITAAATGSGTTVPDNVIPTIAAPTGKIYILLGHYFNDIFTPDACGNFVIGHCPGAITASRA
jgi:hypothetical protein